MPLQPLYAAPGLQLTNSDYADSKQFAYGGGRAATGRWSAGTNIEFVGGFPQKVAGFQQALPAGQMIGVPRSMTTWRDNNGVTRLAIGTEARLYVWDGTTLSDVTPPVPLKTATSGASLAYTANSTSATVTDSNWSDANALQAGDFVYLACAAIGTVPIYGWYPVSNVAVPGGSITYTVTLPAAPNASGTVASGSLSVGYPRSQVSSVITVSGSATVTLTSSMAIGTSAVAFANYYGPYVRISQTITANGLSIPPGVYATTWVSNTTYKITAPSGTANASSTVALSATYQVFGPSMDQAAYGSSLPVTYSPYMVSGSGNLFSNTDYVTFPSTPGLAFGTGAFTVEFWLYCKQLATLQTILDANTNATTNTAWRIYLDNTDHISITCSNGTLSGPSGLTTNGWHHVAITRNSSGILTIYVDGHFIVNTPDSNNYGFGTGTIGINAFSGGVAQPFQGMISNLRITSNQVYTSNFTPPTSGLTAIAGTLLLTCQSSTLIDNSGNNLALTAHGTAAAQAATGNPSYLAVSAPPAAYPTQNFPVGWSLASYGGLLLASPHGGTIYVYDPTVSNAKAYRLEGAPQACVAMFVTPERMVAALGSINVPQPGGLIAAAMGFPLAPACWTPQAPGVITYAGSPLAVSWSDQSDFNQWFSTLTNTANTGRSLIGYGGYFVGGIAVRDGYSLILTNRACFAMSFSGNTEVYDTHLVADNAGLVSPHAICSTGGTAYWLGDKDLWAWSGSAAPLPSDDIRDYFFNTLNPTYQSRCCLGVNRKKKQLRLFYPAGTSTENSASLIYQLDSQVFSTGSIGRSAWEDARLFSTPVAVDSSGTLYYEETGVDANGAALEASITYSSMDLSNGDQTIDFFGFVPDFERLTGSINLTINTKYYPQDPETLSGPYTITAWDSTPRIDLRCDGKLISFTLDSNTVGGDFRLGLPRIQIQPANARQ